MMCVAKKEEMLNPKNITHYMEKTLKSNKPLISLFYLTKISDIHFISLSQLHFELKALPLRYTINFEASKRKRATETFHIKVILTCLMMIKWYVLVG